MPISFILLPLMAVFLAITLVSPIFAWHLFVYLFCTTVANGLLFIVLLMNGVGHSGTGWSKNAEIIHNTTIGLWVVWNIWWTWFVFF